MERLIGGGSWGQEKKVHLESFNIQSESFNVQSFRVPYLHRAGLGLETTWLTHKDTTIRTCALNFNSTAYSGHTEPYLSIQQNITLWNINKKGNMVLVFCF